MGRLGRNEREFRAENGDIRPSSHDGSWPPYKAIPFIIGLSALVWLVIVQTGIALF